jgi:hypothetical protein
MFALHPSPIEIRTRSFRVAVVSLVIILIFFTFAFIFLFVFFLVGFLPKEDIAWDEAFWMYSAHIQWYACPVCKRGIPNNRREKLLERERDPKEG